MYSGRYNQSDSAGGRTGTVWMPIVHMTELFMCGGDAALCQIILTMHLLTWQSSRTQRRDNVISLIYVYSSIVALHYPWSLGLLL